MALYTVIKYNQYFSKAACLSSAISMCFLQLQEDIQNSWIDSDTKVYFSFGTNETTNLDKTYAMYQFFYDQFIDRGASCYINVVQNGNHNEASWEKENPKMCIRDRRNILCSEQKKELLIRITCTTLFVARK